jgi:hypothetical protein
LKKWHTKFRDFVPWFDNFFLAFWLLIFERKLNSHDINLLIKLSSVWLSSTLVMKNCSWYRPFKCIFVEVKHLSQRQKTGG